MTCRIPLAAAGLLLASLVQAADKLDVKTGLWEITSVSTISGMPPVPKEVLDKLTPEQRAAMAAAIKEESEREPQASVERECITQQDIERPFEAADAENCTQTTVRTTRTSQEIRLTCSGKHKGSGVLRISTPTRESMSGDLDLKIGEGGDALTVKSQLRGRWLGPDCGDEDADEDADEDIGDRDEDETEVQ